MRARLLNHYLTNLSRASWKVKRRLRSKRYLDYDDELTKKGVFLLETVSAEEL